MQLHAVIVPPPDVVQAALEAARDLIPPAPAAVEEPRRGLLDRLLARRQAEPPAEPVVTLVPAAPEAVFVRLAKFGNVTVADADGLATALEAAAATWPAPLLRVSKVGVAEAAPFDVTAQLEGDVDALRDIFRNVIEVARLQRFYLDRRTFRSELTLGSVAVEDAGPVPDSVAGAEAPHRGQPWSASRITFVRTSFVDGGTTFAEVARVELADGAEDSGALAGA
jgi:hypothetical protein